MSWDAITRVDMPANEQGRNRFWPSGSVSILLLHQDGARRQASVIQLVFGLLVHVVPGRVRGRHDGVCLHACQNRDVKRVLLQCYRMSCGWRLARPNND